MKVTSGSFEHMGTLSKRQVYDGFDAGGDNLSPDLSWYEFPIDTKSFAIVCRDPDAPKENGWYHWLVVNIPLSVTHLDEGESIPYKQTMTDFGMSGYGGAAPPVGHGLHHYNFVIYALDVETLDVDSDTQPKDVEDAIRNHTLDFAIITATYQR